MKPQARLKESPADEREHVAEGSVPKAMSTDSMAAYVNDAPRDVPAKRVFVVVLIVLLLVPLACMPLFSVDALSEKRELAEAPQLMKDGHINVGFLSDAGDYFLDHFAFRSLLVDVDATIKQKAFLTSATENVVVGTNDWLYYAGTLNDYQRKNSMTDHAILNATRNLALVQEYVTQQGKSFVLAIAPNKNALYAQNMPYYELAGEGESNASRLMESLAQNGIHYVDLHKAFAEQDDVLYFERDSHWTDMGALVAYGEILRALGKEPLAVEDGELVVNKHYGDVDGMLHPQTAAPELQPHATAVDAFRFEGEATSVEDSYIITSALAPTTQAGLMMYRDSFGNNLLQPFATTYRQAVFTKLVPYDMSPRMLAFAQDVVVERTERHLAFFSTDPPYAPALERKEIEVQGTLGGSTTVFTQQSDPYVVVEGTLDESVVGEDARVYVALGFADGSERVFEAYLVSQADGAGQDFEGDGAEDSSRSHIQGDWGYRVYLPQEIVGDGDPASLAVRVLAGDAQHAAEIARL